MSSSCCCTSPPDVVEEDTPFEPTFAPDESLPMPAASDLPNNPEALSNPSIMLRSLKKSRTTNLELAHKIASRIRDPDYSLKSFHHDLCEAFPELTYYMIHGSKVSSGGTPADEYKRTMGAAFAFYWLMRIGIDGECGFCFGVDDDWAPNIPPAGFRHPSGTFFTHDGPQRRLAFFLDAQWAQLNQLLVDAGCLKKRAGGKQSDSRKNSRRASSLKKDDGGSSSGGGGGGLAEKSEKSYLSEKSSLRWDRAARLGQPSGTVMNLMKSPLKLARQGTAMLGMGGGGGSSASGDGGYGYPTMFRGSSLYVVDESRTVGMLVLTAIHDIMKIEALLPTVVPATATAGEDVLGRATASGSSSSSSSSRGTTANGGYRGYAPGDTISDHDIALAYVLEHFGDELPSYSTLPDELRRLINFTQAKIGFNHGWLVQAEATPGALFSQFKKVIQDNGATPSDVAFYFVHWLTDLAGAVPTPLRGSEKFVIQFPHFVLASFVKSFPVIHRLASRTETEVLEDYLTERWAELQPGLGPLPTGEDAVAVMRIVVQAQNPKEQAALMNAYELLAESDRATLSREMALTGIAEQHYRISKFEIVGPAILVYYSPAFLRSVAKKSPIAALQMLACIYKGARELWPGMDVRESAEAAEGGGGSKSGDGSGSVVSRVHARSSQEADLSFQRARRHSSSTIHTIVEGTVTVRIDQVKDMTTEMLLEAHKRNGDVWYIAKKNDLEAVVIRQAPAEMPPPELSDSSNCRVLPLVASFAPEEATEPAVPLADGGFFGV